VEVVGVDPGKRPLLRRILGQNVGQHVKSEAIVDFASIEPFVAHVPTARLRIPYRKLSKLHPAQIADLVEQASHEEGEEIIEASGRYEPVNSIRCLSRLTHTRSVLEVRATPHASMISSPSS